MANIHGTTFIIQIDDLYAWVLLVAGLLGFQCLLTGFIYGGGLRSKLFTEELLNEKYGDEHKKITGQTVPKGGYPDCGNGVYSDLLSYKDWFEFNINQRVHKNFLETLTIAIFNIMTLGLVWPITALSLGCVQFCGRAIYTIGYRVSPNGSPREGAAPLQAHCWTTTLVNVHD